MNEMPAQMRDEREAIQMEQEYIKMFLKEQIQINNLPKGRRCFGIYPANDITSDGKRWGIATAAQSYCNGYQTGANWKHDYHPGGPYYTQWSRNDKDDSDWKAYCDATVENYNEWHRGFKDGRAGRTPNPQFLYDVSHVAELGYN